MKTQQGRHKRKMFSLHSSLSSESKRKCGKCSHSTPSTNSKREKNFPIDSRSENYKFFIFLIWKITGRRLKCHIVTYLEEFGDCRIHDHQRTMNQVNDAISHRNISHHDLGQHDAGGVLWIANNRIRLDIHCANISSVIRINKPLNRATYFWFVCHRSG